MPLDTVTPTIALVREQLARGMSDEAVRLALGIRARDWPGLRAAATSPIAAEDELPAPEADRRYRPRAAPAPAPVAEPAADPRAPPRIRDSVLAQAVLLREIVLQESGLTLMQIMEFAIRGKTSPASVARGYLAWLLRSHVASISMGEIAALINRTPMACYDAVRRTRTALGLRCGSAGYVAALMELHRKVRRRIETTPCPTCDRIERGDK